MNSADPRATQDDTPPVVETPEYRPVERFWPYLDVPEQPTEEELARLDPELAEVLFGAQKRPFSMSLEFPEFDGPRFKAALDLARASDEYLEVRVGDQLRHRARFYPSQANRMRDLFEIVGGIEGSEVLIDDRPVPYARQLWLPLMWFLIS